LDGEFDAATCFVGRLAASFHHFVDDDTRDTIIEEGDGFRQIGSYELRYHMGTERARRFDGVAQDYGIARAPGDDGEDFRDRHQSLRSCGRIMRRAFPEANGADHRLEALR
jgi:hypothetical protein